MKKYSLIVLLILLCSSIPSAQPISVVPSTTAFVFPNGVSVPSDYPHVSISFKNNPDTGLIFINNWGGTPYIAILDNNGSPVFYRRMPSYARDFKVQRNGLLSYRLAGPYYRFFEMDSAYQLTREITAQYGFGTDEHELLILPNGNVMLIALENKTVDMSTKITGGKQNATVIGNHIQEIEPNGTVAFEWKSWDHFDILDAVHENLTAQTIDYVHMNALDIDTDGNILVSSRHLSEITKINRATGAIMWRLGGKHNQFTYVGDPFNGPSYQHDIRALPNGRYTIMDNGNFHSPRVTRAVEYEIDTVSMTATMVWQYRHVPDRYTWWMGNVQRLPNGNTLINWADGAFPKLTEVTPTGEKAMELGFVNFAHSYRVFRFPWKGQAKAPVIELEAGTDKVTLYINKFDQSPGHTFLLYIDTLPNPSRFVDSTSLSAVDLTGFFNGKKYFFRVTAREASGKESPFSNEESVTVKLLTAGDNLLLNSDFSNGMDHWIYSVTSPAVGFPFVSANGEFLAQISNGGSEAWHIQLSQPGIPVMNGLKYRFEFDAFASGNRFIDPKVVMIASPNTNYSKTSSIYLTPVKKHFSFDFTMQDATDFNARVVFNCGLSDIDVTIDNVEVKQLVPSAVTASLSAVPENFSLQQNYPNPFNPSTTILYGLPAESRVRMQIFDMLGQKVTEQQIGVQQAGWHRTTWIPHSPSGVYFYRITAQETERPNATYVRTQKMVFLK